MNRVFRNVNSRGRALVLRSFGLLLVLGVVLAGCQRGTEPHADHPAPAVEAMVYTCPMHPSVKQDHPGKCPICGMDLVKLEAPSATTPAGGQASAAGTEAGESAPVYTCPMHPSVKQDHPGKCPICGMDLVKLEPAVDAAAAAAPVSTSVAGPPISLDARSLQLAGVRTTRVEERALEAEVRAVGRIDYDERRIKQVSARIDGRIERLHVDFTGAKVRRGQTLLELYSPQMLATQEDYLLARGPGGTSGDPTGSGRLAASALKRLELWGMTAAQRAKLEQTGKPMLTLDVASPIAGTVLEKAALEGSYVKEGDPLFKIADLSTIWVLADIYEKDLGRLEVGTSATVRGPGTTGSLSGRISFIYPRLDEATRTVQARIPLSNPGEKLLPGMSVEVVLRPAAGRGLAVPSAAVVRTGLGAVAYVKVKEGTFEPRRLEIGLEHDGYIQVLEGLHAGEEVAASGTFLIDSQTQLTGGQSALWSGATEVGGGTGTPASPTGASSPPAGASGPTGASSPPAGSTPGHRH